MKNSKNLSCGYGCVLVLCFLSSIIVFLLQNDFWIYIALTGVILCALYIPFCFLIIMLTSNSDSDSKNQSDKKQELLDPAAIYMVSKNLNDW